MPELSLGILIAGGAVLLAAGYAVGWWIKGLTFLTHKAVLDELWTRKLKFAEQKAVDAEMLTSRLGAQHHTQEKAMEAAREWTEELEVELSQRGAVIKDHSRELEDGRVREERITRDLVRHSEYKDELDSENDGLRVALDQRGSELDEVRGEFKTLQVKSAELESAVSDRETKLTSSKAQETELREQLDQRAEAIAALEHEAAELAKNPPLLTQRNELLARWENEVRVLPEESSDQAEQVALEIDQLDPLVGALVRRDRKGLMHKRALKEAKQELRQLEQETESMRSEGEENGRLRDQLEEKSNELFAVKTEHEAAAAKLGELRNELTTSQSALKQANNEIGQSRTLFDESHSETAGAVTELETRIEGLQARVKELEPLEAKLAAAGEAQEEVQAAQQQLNAAWEERDLLQGQLTETEKQAEETLGELQERHASLETDLAELAPLQAELKAEQEQQSALRKELAQAVAEAAASQTELEALSSQPQESKKKAPAKKTPAKKAAASKKPKQGNDDLREISGVGPKLSDALIKMGVTSYLQIANLKPADLPDFADKIGTTAARIKRDKWIASAKKQHKAKYGVKA